MFVGRGFGEFYQELLLPLPALNTNPLDLQGSRVEIEDNESETWVQMSVVMVYVQN
jgi:hypothetical protein